MPSVTINASSQLGAANITMPPVHHDHGLDVLGLDAFEAAQHRSRLSADGAGDDDVVPMLIGAHDDDDGGGGKTTAANNDDGNCDMFNMSDFRRFCESNGGGDDDGGSDDGDGKSMRLSLSCLDEPLPQALHSLLMELDGAEPDLAALINDANAGAIGHCADDVSSTDNSMDIVTSPVAAGTAARFSDSDGLSWSD